MKKWKFGFSVILAIALWCGAAGADIAYTVVDSGYSAGSIGTIMKEEADFTIGALKSGFGGDPWVYSFIDADGKDKAVLREFQYSGDNDSVYIYDPIDLNAPIANTNKWGRNLYGVAREGEYLYLALQDVYSATGDTSGQVARIKVGDYDKDPDKIHAFSAESIADADYFRKPAGVTVANGKVYVLNQLRDVRYAPLYGEIVELDLDLNPTGKTARIGKNPSAMAFYDGKLYVACAGGMLGSGEYGSVWEVSLSNMSAARLVDLERALGASPAFQAMDITITPRGTAYILVYNMNWPTIDARIYKASVGDLA
ncbi:MAG: hypothetical protein LBD04_00255, partial [Synergistaceae bacterium]|nr:hypothetical protein [Synergistaceae bacterium]